MSVLKTWKTFLLLECCWRGRFYWLLCSNVLVADFSFVLFFFFYFYLIISFPYYNMYILFLLYIFSKKKNCIFMIQDLQFILYFMLFCFQLICIKQKVICLNKIEILLCCLIKILYIFCGAFLWYIREKKRFLLFICFDFFWCRWVDMWLILWQKCLQL